MKKYVILCFLYLVNSLTATSNDHLFDYDLIVIGAGAAGLTAANIAHDLGMSTLLIEKNEVGGGRIWSGDIPFKALFESAKVLDLFKRAQSFGLKFTSDTSLFADALFPRVRSIQQKVYALAVDELERKQNIKTMFGEPRFIDVHTIMLDGSSITSKFFVIATGSRLYIPPFVGLETIDFLSRDNFFQRDKLPKSLIIIGGGPLGVEMASCLSKFGVKITLLMRHGSLLPSFDYEIIDLLTQNLLDAGVFLRCDMKANEVRKTDNGVSVVCYDRGGNRHLYEAEACFLATGSIPSVDGLGLLEIGVKFSNWGIATNRHLQTSVPNIYACGDVVGAMTLSRVAYYHAKAAVLNMNKKSYQLAHNIDYSAASKVIFSLPQLATAGITEQEAYKKYGDRMRVYRCPYSNIEKALIESADCGMAKFICDEAGILLGVHVLGAAAGEIVDSVSVGEKFSKFAFDEISKVRTSPNYFDVIQKMAYLCRNETKKELSESFFGHYLKVLTSYFFGEQIEIA